MPWLRRFACPTRWSWPWRGLVLSLAGVLLIRGVQGAETPPPAQPAQPTQPVQPLPYAPAVAARFPEPAVVYDTPVLAPGSSGFTSNEALAAQLAALATAATPAAPAGSAAASAVAVKTPAVTRITLLQPGRSQDGLPLQALHFSRGPGRPLVLLIGQQHGDEPAGAEALLVLARLLATGDLAPVLEQVDVTLLPRANPDGADWARRNASDGRDINRDHLLLRTPEARAIARLVRQQRPVVVVDLHEHTVLGRYLGKFNAVQRNDLLLQYAMVANLPPRLSNASEAWFHQPMVAALSAQGLRSEWYYTNPTTPGDLTLAMGGVQPDTARNVNGLRHAVSLLLESRGVGLHRLHLARRIHSHVVALRSVLQQAAAQADALRSLQAAADAEVAASACHRNLVVEAAATPTRRTLLMLDPDTGADKPVDVAWDSALQLRPITQRARPCGYWLDASAPQARLTVARLQALGLRVQQLGGAQDLAAEAWVETARTQAPRPDVRGRVADAEQPILRLVVDLHAGTLAVPAGSWYVPLDQPLAHLAVAALEPDSQSSYLANRLIERLADVQRVMSRPAGPLLDLSPPL